MFYLLVFFKFYFYRPGVSYLTASVLLYLFIHFYLFLVETLNKNKYLLNVFGVTFYYSTQHK